MQTDRDARIRERAYQIWLTEGRVEGKQDDHWHRAEREIAAEEASTAGGEAGIGTRVDKTASKRPAGAPVRRNRRKPAKPAS